MPELGDDGSVHGFWHFIIARRAAGEPADVDTLLGLLLLILIYDAVTP